VEKKFLSCLLGTKPKTPHLSAIKSDGFEMVYGITFATQNRFSEAIYIAKGSSLTSHSMGQDIVVKRFHPESSESCSPPL
jgi:hypothetical protein